MVIYPKHNELLKKYENKIDIYRREQNGGVARTKNTSIRLLLEKKIDIGFLADDDVLYKPNCLNRYIELIKETKHEHISYCQMNPIVHPITEWNKMGYIKRKINNLNVMLHKGMGVGCWLSFTPKIIKQIGYFKVMEGKYGYEHINFTYRCLYNKLIYVIDIVDPEKDCIEHIGFEPICKNKYKKSHSISEDYRKKENQKNKEEWKKDLDKFVPLIE